MFIATHFFLRGFVIDIFVFAIVIFCNLKAMVLKLKFYHA